MKLTHWKRMAVVGAVGLAALGMPSPARAAKLQVGDPAPPLRTGRWVQGERVATFAKDKAYIVEFWATWCGPCRVSIPHLNDLHLKFKDKGLIVIGQDVWEQDPDLVSPFVEKMGAQMTYRVALDTEAGTMAETWMEAADQNGIPACFVVNKDGKIAWIGHPLKLKEDLLTQVLDGTFNLEKAIAQFRQQAETADKTRGLWSEFNAQRQKKDWAQAEAALARLESFLVEEDRENLAMTRFNLALDRQAYPDARRLATQLSDKHLDDAMMQNQMAWRIVTTEGVTAPDLALAEKIARRGSAAAQDKNAEVLDTLARALFLQGQKEAAVETQQKAVAFAEGQRQVQFQRVLANYQAGQLPNDAVLSKLQRELSSQLKVEDWDKAESTLLAMEKLLDPAERDELGMTRFRVLLGRKDFRRAYQLAEQLSESHADKPMFQNQLAWEIVTGQGIEERNLDVAEKIARRGHEATEGRNAEIVDTLARVLFLKGQKEAAIELQKKAVELAKGHRRSQFQETLQSYQAGTQPKDY